VSCCVNAPLPPKSRFLFQTETTCMIVSMFLPILYTWLDFMLIQGHKANLRYGNHSAVRNSVSDMANKHKGLHSTLKRLKFILLCASLNTQNIKNILKLVTCVFYVTWHITSVCEPYKTRFQTTKYCFIMGLYRRILHGPQHFQCWYLVSTASKYVLLPGTFTLDT